MSIDKWWIEVMSVAEVITEELDRFIARRLGYIPNYIPSAYAYMRFLYEGLDIVIKSKCDFSHFKTLIEVLRKRINTSLDEMDVEYSCFEILEEYKNLVSTIVGDAEKVLCYDAVCDIEPIALAELHESSMEMVGGIVQNLITQRITTIDMLVDYILFLSRLSKINLYRMKYITGMIESGNELVLGMLTDHRHMDAFINSLPNDIDGVVRLVREYGNPIGNRVGYEIDRDEKKAKIIMDFMCEYYKILIGQGRRIVN